MIHLYRYIIKNIYIIITVYIYIHIHIRVYELSDMRISSMLQYLECLFTGPQKSMFIYIFFLFQFLWSTLLSFVSRLFFRIRMMFLFIFLFIFCIQFTSTPLYSIYFRCGDFESRQIYSNNIIIVVDFIICICICCGVIIIFILWYEYIFFELCGIEDVVYIWLCVPKR